MLKFPKVPNPYVYATPTEPYNEVIVACVNVGDKYPAEYVQRLERMVAAHMSVPHQFWCLTDNPTLYKYPIVITPNRGGLGGWWSKFSLFHPNAFPEGHRIIYLDLDIVVTGSLDELAACRDEFIMIENYSPNKGHAAYNSSCMSWTHGGFVSNLIHAGWKNEFMAQTHGDQEVIWMLADGHITAWPEPWMPSYKYHCRGNGLPAAAKLVVFHGDPKPTEVKDPWVAEYRDIP